MKIEAITVCVGYSDFLNETVRLNKGLFDSWTIVTEARDEATREVCRKHNLKTLLSDDGKNHGTDFNKGRLIQRALHTVSAEGWRLHIDADIALPLDFKHRLRSADLCKDTIYGVDRLMLHSFKEWRECLASGYLQGEQFDFHCRQRFLAGKEVGSRWTHPQFGYVPIGFFQLWHSSADEWHGAKIKHYPHEHSNACRSDVQHGLQWDRPKRQLLPEIISVHLESERAPLGVNWKGRKTKYFGPDKKDLDAGVYDDWSFKEPNSKLKS